jgi:hypothetical protein
MRDRASSCPRLALFFVKLKTEQMRQARRSCVLPLVVGSPHELPVVRSVFPGGCAPEDRVGDCQIELPLPSNSLAENCLETLRLL